MAFGASQLLTGLAPLARLTGEASVLLLAYGGFLLFVAGEKTQYAALLRGILGRPEPGALAST